MLATLGPPPSRGDWATEIKYDGQRGICVVEDVVTIFTRNGADVSRTFPELAHVRAAVGARRMILDGEIVAVDSDGRPSFTRLQRRWPQQRRPNADLVRAVPTRLLAFDILAIDGIDITDQPYGRRREILSTVMEVDSSAVLTIPRNWVDVAPADMLEVCAANGMEGIVAKRVDSPYRPGRSSLWIKSMVRPTAELVIVGYIPASQGGGSVAALLVAGHDDTGDLVLVGQVGTGMSQRERRRLFQLFEPHTSPEAPVEAASVGPDVLWMTPRYVGEIAYREYVPGGRLRHPSWKGLRNSSIRTAVVPDAT